VFGRLHISSPNTTAMNRFKVLDIYTAFSFLVNSILVRIRIKNEISYKFFVNNIKYRFH